MNPIFKPVLDSAKVCVNIGSGYHPVPGFVNFDSNLLYKNVSLRKFLLKAAIKKKIITPKAISLANENLNLEYADLANGIPLPDCSVDLLYSSHLIEHIPHDSIVDHLNECRRVLRLGGVYRIVAPDLVKIAKRYVKMTECLVCASLHEDYMNVVNIASDMFAQIIPRYPAHWSQYSPPLRLLLKVLKGNTYRSGDAHRWMYSPQELLWLSTNKCGYSSACLASFNSTNIKFPLDISVLDSDSLNPAKPRKADSFYVEIVK